MYKTLISIPSTTKKKKKDKHLDGKRIAMLEQQIRSLSLQHHIAVASALE
jgi:hypothetical protein